MGFDNECILNIQSLAGEYFCPVCRLLVYPNEALQSQCTHLYCKPCLTYIVSTSHACPYDGYLVTEADSKPLVESDKTLAETIGKIAVHCLYHRSGCAWQGELSECITHCTGCSFGNSPVVCNRCGTQIVHRQVQEHAQNCPGVQPQAQQSDGSQVATTATGATATATSEQNQATTQAGVATSQAQVAQIATAASSSQDQSQVNTNSQPQAAIQAAPTPEQLYQQQQQYQQYYQQYPGYDPYQQQYQQYGSYQQQAYPQYQQQHPPQVIPVQQPQMYVQAQPQVLPQAQPQAQPQPQPQAQAQPQAQVPVRPQAQPQPQGQPQPPTHAYPQAQVGGQPQVQAQVNAPTQLQPSHPHPQMQPQTYAQQPQIYAQAQPHPQQLQVQPHLQQRPQVPQHQQQHSKHTQPQQQTLPYLQPQGAAQTQQSQLQHHTHAPAQPQTQPQLQARPQAQPQTQPQHPASHTVTGHQSYPQPQPNQQLVPGASQVHPVHMNHQQQGAPRQMPQHTVQVQAQFPQQQLVQMRPPASHVPMQQQQQQAMLPQGQHPNVPPAQQHVHPQAHQPNQSVHQYPGVHLPHQPSTAQQQAQGHSLYPQAFPGQAPGLAQNTQQPAQFIQQQVVQPQLRPQVHPAALPPASLAQQQLQQNVPISHGLQSHQSQNYAGRPMLPNHGLPHQPFQPSTAGPAGPTSSKMMLSGGLQTYPPRSNIRPQSSAEQQPGYMQQAVPPQSGNESVPFPTSAAPQTHVSSMKAGLLPEAASQVTDSKEAIEQKQESETKSVDGDKMSEGEGKSSHINSNVKESSESSQTLEKDPMASSQKGLDEPMVKNMVKEEVTAKSESSAGTLPDTSVQKQDGSSHIAQKKQDENSQLEDKEVQVDVPKNLSSQEADILNRKDVKVPNDAMDSQEKATLQGSTHVSDRNMDSLSLHEKNMLQPQGSRLGPGHMQDSSFLQPGHVVSVSDKQQLPMNFGPSHMYDRKHQRPQIPDQMSQQNIHPHQMQMPGLPSTHMRPQGNALLSQGHPSSAPTHFQQSIAKQPLNSFHPEVFGPGSSAPFGRGPGSFGPQGHLNIGQMPPHHAGGPRIRGDPAGGPPFAGQPPGAFDSQAIIMGRVPQSGQQMPANPMDSESIANKRTGYFDGRPSDSHMPGSADRVPFGQPPNMQSDHMKVNGGAAMAVSGGLSNPSFPYASQDRFKHFPEERFRQLPEVNLPGEERISSFSVESGRRSINHREFFDDLKHFPRPTHLSSDHVPKSESYMSSSRPLDMAPHGFTGDARLKLDGSGSTAVSRLLPPYQAGGLRPFDLRDDHTGLHPVLNRSASEFGRLRMDGFPPLRSPGRQFPDIPSSRFGRIEDSDGREARAFGERSKPFNLHSDSNPFLESRFPILPSHLRGEPDVPGNLRLGERAHMRGGDLVGPDILPSHLRSSGPMGPHNLRMGEPGGFGTYPNPLRSGDAGGPGNLPLHLRIGESTLGNLPNHSRPGFSSSMPIHGFASDAGFSNAGEVDPLDHSRKRKHGSMGWCRICKVDCETVEGLEMHSQTREHQKMAMDMVLNIKKDNAKKQKVSSDDHTSHDGETNKARKTNIENHGK